MDHYTEIVGKGVPTLRQMSTFKGTEVNFRWPRVNWKCINEGVPDSIFELGCCILEATQLAKEVYKKNWDWYRSPGNKEYTILLVIAG